MTSGYSLPPDSVTGLCPYQVLGFHTQSFWSGDELSYANGSIYPGNYLIIFTSLADSSESYVVDYSDYISDTWAGSWDSWNMGAMLSDLLGFPNPNDEYASAGVYSVEFGFDHPDNGSLCLSDEVLYIKIDDVDSEGCYNCSAGFLDITDQTECPNGYITLFWNKLLRHRHS